jgi:hypothetical protein
MSTKWHLEMHHPGNPEHSLITTDNFEFFSDVQEKMKQNREMVFFVQPPVSAQSGDLSVLDEMRSLGLKIKVAPSRRILLAPNENDC